MRTRQRERRLVVIELRSLPTRGGVARGARGRESAGNVIRVRGPGEVLQMAARAIGGGCRIRPRHMALDARRGNVRAGQRELGSRMIEEAALPLHNRVAQGAVGGESRELMVGVLRIVEIGDMT